MSDLTQFRDHAKRLSASEHRDDCDRIHRVTKVDRWLSDHGLDPDRSCERTDGHDSHEWVDSLGFGWFCPGLCSGCMPDVERSLWTRLGDEIDAYLAGDAPQPDLFGGVSDEPGEGA